MARPKSARPIILLRVTNSGFEPATALDAEAHRRLTLGAEVEAEVNQGKSNLQMRLYWGFLQFVVDATGCHGSATSLSNSLLASLGYLASFTAMVGGGANAEPMSVRDMDGPDFNEYCAKAFARIATDYEVDLDDYRAHLRNRRG